MKISKKELFKLCDENNDAINELQSQSDSTNFLLAVLIQQLKDSGVIDEISPEPKPNLKQLDQSVFDGLDSKWKYAAVDEVGLLKAFTYEPKLSVTRTGFILLIGSTMDIGTGYDASNWRNSLIRRDTARKLTGSELCMAMLERGDKYVMCLVNNCGLYNTLQDEPSVVIHHCENGFYVRDSYYEYAMPVNNQGEPLTAAEVGL